MILAITQVKNVRLIKVLESNNLYKIYYKKTPNIRYLQVLGFTIYIFIYKEKQNLKSEKFETQALKNILVEYNRHTIFTKSLSNPRTMSYKSKIFKTLRIQVRRTKPL